MNALDGVLCSLLVIAYTVLQIVYISISHFQTNEELDVTVDRCKKVENKSQEAHAKADQERKAMKKDLDGVRDDLQKIRWLYEIISTNVTVLLYFI